ncbi:MAG: ATP-binding cassette domain-containing protein [Candidatus Heimdallarchaeum aukensis]|uniref:ATP-binding cassette domain-containing protein n=1 Tax=Candidatus Heimdallarchaeum aukensis TaxID=2876573 RepID=A0A9Y1FMS0_9ARCH|nr:MAG: ATP-binding cassette domain-containing protein [Candidatus Heimdallarchaeum aukensis]
MRSFEEYEVIDTDLFSAWDPNKFPILETKNLKKWFPVAEQSLLYSKTVNFIKAVDGVNLFLNKGETLGLVGESGCGKSTTSKTIIKLEEPTEGSVYFKGIDMFQPMTRVEELAIKRQIQMVFQDPYASLNPRRMVLDIIKEPFDIHFADMPYEEKEARVLEILSKVGLEDYHALRYPHEFSGGQRQRIGIARALAMNPEVILLDEPVSALDVSVQAQILNLLHDLQIDFKLTYMFIAHDLSVIKHVSDRVAVMYLGKIMEMAPTGELFRNTAHPYTIALLSAIPRPDPRIKMDRIILEGDPPSPINTPSGCPFHPRCWKAKEVCSQKQPPLEEVKPNHYVSCWFPEI